MALLALARGLITSPRWANLPIRMLESHTMPTINREKGLGQKKGASPLRISTIAKVESLQTGKGRWGHDKCRQEPAAIIPLEEGDIDSQCPQRRKAYLLNHIDQSISIVLLIEVLVHLTIYSLMITLP